MSFQSAFEFTLREEGGYSNNPNDRGGATNYGVIQTTYDEYRDRIHQPRQPVKNITFDEVTSIYKGFWDAANCGIVDKSGYPKTAQVMFDIAINSGPIRAIKILQLALVCKDDGILGSVTVNALKAYTDMQLADRMCTYRMWFYVRLVNANHSQAEFLLGWLLRNKRLRKSIGDARFLG